MNKRFYALILVFVLSFPSYYIVDAQTSTLLILDQPPSNANKGDVMTFTGRLSTTDGQYCCEGATIFIMDRDYFTDSDLLGSGVIDTNGRFAIEWIVDFMDFGGAVDVIAGYWGNADFDNALSAEYPVYVSLPDSQDTTPPSDDTVELTVEVDQLIKETLAFLETAYADLEDLESKLLQQFGTYPDLLELILQESHDERQLVRMIDQSVSDNNALLVEYASLDLPSEIFGNS